MTTSTDWATNGTDFVTRATSAATVAANKAVADTVAKTATEAAAKVNQAAVDTATAVVDNARRAVKAATSNSTAATTALTAAIGKATTAAAELVTATAGVEAPSFDTVNAEVQEVQQAITAAGKSAGTTWLDAYDKGFGVFLQFRKNVTDSIQVEAVKSLAENNTKALEQLNTAYTEAIRDLLR